MLLGDRGAVSAGMLGIGAGISSGYTVCSREKSPKTLA